MAILPPNAKCAPSLFPPAPAEVPVSVGVDPLRLGEILTRAREVESGEPRDTDTRY